MCIEICGGQMVDKLNEATMEEALRRVAGQRDGGPLMKCLAEQTEEITLALAHMALWSHSVGKEVLENLRERVDRMIPLTEPGHIRDKLIANQFALKICHEMLVDYHPVVIKHIKTGMVAMHEAEGSEHAH